MQRITEMFRRLRFIGPALALVLLLGACSDIEQKTIFEPEVGHPANWIFDHGSAALDQGNSCPECHGSDLRGGASQVSCFLPQINGIPCHQSGEGKRHTAGWSLSSEHGRAAKDAPGISSGLASCQACHGDGYDGGTSNIPCSSCHGVDAPHPRSPWLYSHATHTSTDEENASACGECHLNPETSEAPGCFNGSLCHLDRQSHPAGWASPDYHGAAAKENPGLGGLEECQTCHGEDYGGGLSEVDCFSCHEIHAPHGGQGWIGGGLDHRSTGEENAEACAACHDELASPPDCFSANACHQVEAVDPDEPIAPPPDPDIPPDDPAAETPPPDDVQAPN